MARRKAVPADNTEFLLKIGSKIKRCQLLNLGGECRFFHEAKNRARKKGFTILTKKWLRAFRRKFPVPTRDICVVAGTREWMEPYGHRLVTYIHEHRKAWWLDSHCADHDFGVGYRWLSSHE